jgi:hypothetical protein
MTHVQDIVGVLKCEDLRDGRTGWRARSGASIGVAGRAA